METRISIVLTIPEEIGFGEARAYITKWDGGELCYTARAWSDKVAIAPFSVEDSVYPYAIAALRTMCDRAVADMMEKFARGQVLLMHEVGEQQKM